MNHHVDMLTVAEAAAHLGISERWTRHLIRTGELPALRPANTSRGRIRITRPAIDGYLVPATRVRAGVQVVER